MSAEAIAGTAAGVTTTGLAMMLDQSLLMASAGGCFLYLAYSVSIPIQTRFFASMGSFVLGCIVGAIFMTFGGLEIWAAIGALISSATGATAVGSVHRWFDGGPMPKWIRFFVKFIPFTWKKGGSGD